VRGSRYALLAGSLGARFVNVIAYGSAVIALPASSVKGLIQRFRAGKVEATTGFEPVNRGFAVLALTRVTSESEVGAGESPGV